MLSSDEQRPTASRRDLDLQDVVARVSKELEEKESLQATVQILKGEIARSTENKLQEQEILKAEHLRELETHGSKYARKQKELESVAKELEKTADTLRDRDLFIMRLKGEESKLKDKLCEYEDRLEKQDNALADQTRKTVQLKRELDELKDSHEAQIRNLAKKNKEEVADYEEAASRLQSKIKVLETQLMGSESKQQLHQEELTAAKREVQESTAHHKQALEKQSALQSENTKLHMDLLSAKAELEKLKDSIVFKSTQIREISTETSKLQLLQKEWEEQKKSLQSRNLELAKEVSGLQDELKDYRLKQRDHKKEAEKQALQLLELQAALDTTHSKLESQQHTLTSELEKQLHAVRSVQEQLLKERATTQRLRSELESASQNLRRSQEKVLALQSEVAGLRSHTQDMEVLVADKIQTSNATLRSLSQTASTAKKHAPVREEVASD